jgi:hypothetical protein
MQMKKYVAVISDTDILIHLAKAKQLKILEGKNSLLNMR